jgi:peroxiredoxin
VSPVWLSLLTLLAAAPPPELRTVGEFALPDHQGRTHRLSDVAESKLVVVVFLGVDCPLAKLYAPRLCELQREYAPKGVTFLAVDANERDTPRDLARFVTEYSLSFPLLKDGTAAVADTFGATRSPEAFVLDAKHAIRYRGRIDDAATVKGRRAEPTRHDLRLALDELLAGRPVTLQFTQAGGCPISRHRRSDKVTVTWNRDVLPIVQGHCQGCHRPGQSAPFSLLSHDDAVAWAGAMREVVEEGRMPPWSADPRHGKFANDPSLSVAQKRLLLAWIDGGCPEGDPADAPPPRTFPKQWTIPAPDVVISMPEPFRVPAQGVVDYVYIRVDPGFREDRWVRAAEIMPGNRAVVHHCSVYLQPPGDNNVDQLAQVGQLESFCLTTAAANTPPMLLPEGRAKRIPAGFRLVFVMHYQTIGSPQVDCTSLGLTFADPASVRQEVATRLMYDPTLRIPPRVADHRVEQTWAVNRDVQILSFFPHMHLRGKSFRYDLIRPDGSEEILLDVPRFDFGWQHRYDLAEPLRVSAGSQLRCTAVFDNSSGNAANPNPDVEVRAGEQSWDEMFNGYFDVVLADEDRTRPPSLTDQLWPIARRVGSPGVTALVVLVGGVFLGRARLGAWLRARSEPGSRST